MFEFICVYALARSLLLSLLLTKSCLFVARRHAPIAILLIQQIHLIQLYIIAIVVDVVLLIILLCRRLILRGDHHLLLLFVAIHIVCCIVVLIMRMGMLQYLMVDPLTDFSLVVCRLEFFFIIIILVLIIVRCRKAAILVSFEPHLLTPSVAIVLMSSSSLVIIA